MQKKIPNSKMTLKKTWGTINEIINKRRVKTKFPPFFEVRNKKITDKNQIADEMNTYFSTIGQTLADEIDSTGLPSMESYLGQKPPSNFTFRPTNHGKNTQGFYS